MHDELGGQLQTVCQRRIGIEVFGVTWRDEAFWRDSRGFLLSQDWLPITIARFALTIEPWEMLYPDRPPGNFLHLQSMIPVIRTRALDEVAARIAKLQIGESPILLIARDETGTPYLFQHCDVRDIVRGLQLPLENPVAIGEAFNLSGPAPFSYDQAVIAIEEQAGRLTIDVDIPGPPIRVHHSTAKARGMLGYAPRHDFRGTLEEALRTDPGQSPS